jgi:hypothetical protein
MNNREVMRKEVLTRPQSKFGKPAENYYIHKDEEKFYETLLLNGDNNHRIVLEVADTETAELLGLGTGRARSAEDYQGGGIRPVPAAARAEAAQVLSSSATERYDATRAAVAQVMNGE